MSSNNNNFQVYFSKTKWDMTDENIYEKINAELKNMHTSSEINKCKLPNCEKCINFFAYIYPSSMIKSIN